MWPFSPAYSAPTEADDTKPCHRKHQRGPKAKPSRRHQTISKKYSLARSLASVTICRFPRGVHRAISLKLSSSKTLPSTVLPSRRHTRRTRRCNLKREKRKHVNTDVLSLLLLVLISSSVLPTNYEEKNPVFHVHPKEEMGKKQKLTPLHLSTSIYDMHLLNKSLTHQPVGVGLFFLLNSFWRV